MRAFLLSVFVLLSVLVAGVFTARAVAWKRYVDKRSFYAEQTAGYLFGPSGVIDASGADVSRQQLIDTYLHQYAESLGLGFKKK